MIYPNKVINYKDSIIGKMLIILDYLNANGVDIRELYHQTSDHFDEIIEFIYSIEVLNILDIIDYDKKEGLIYVKTN